MCHTVFNYITFIAHDESPMVILNSLGFPTRAPLPSQLRDKPQSADHYGTIDLRSALIVVFYIILYHKKDVSRERCIFRAAVNGSHVIGGLPVEHSLF